MLKLTSKMSKKCKFLSPNVIIIMKGYLLNNDSEKCQEVLQQGYNTV
jgi:hypothetical protein